LKQITQMIMDGQSGNLADSGYGLFEYIVLLFSWKCWEKNVQALRLPVL